MNYTLNIATFANKGLASNMSQLEGECKPFIRACLSRMDYQPESDSDATSDEVNRKSGNYTRSFPLAMLVFHNSALHDCPKEPPLSGSIRTTSGFLPMLLFLRTGTGRFSCACFAA